MARRVTTYCEETGRPLLTRTVPTVLTYSEVEHLPKETHWDEERDAMIWTFTFIDDSKLQYIALSKLYLISEFDQWMRRIS